MPNPVDCPKGVAGEDNPNGEVALEDAPNMLDDDDGALPNGLLGKELDPKLL